MVGLATEPYPSPIGGVVIVWGAAARRASWLPVDPLSSRTPAPATRSRPGRDCSREGTVLIEAPDQPSLIDYRQGPVDRWLDLARHAIARDLPDQRSFSDALADASGSISALLATAPTLIPGDLSPANTPIHGRKSIPIDWEWAGIGAGEVDPTAMVDGWPMETEACLARYQESMWPLGEPALVERRLAAARVFLAARGLGDLPIGDGGRMVEHQVDQMRHGLQTLDVSDSGDSRPPEPGS